MFVGSIVQEFAALILRHVSRHFESARNEFWLAELIKSLMEAALDAEVKVDDTMLLVLVQLVQGCRFEKVRKLYWSCNSRNCSDVRMDVWFGGAPSHLIRQNCISDHVVQVGRSPTMVWGAFVQHEGKVQGSAQMGLQTQKRGAGGASTPFCIAL